MGPTHPTAGGALRARLHLLAAEHLRHWFCLGINLQRLSPCLYKIKLLTSPKV